MKQVAWTPGLKMVPHLFQQSDALYERRLERSLRALEEDAWGVEHVALERAPTVPAAVVLRSLRATFPDGTLCAWEGEVRLALPSLRVEPMQLWVTREGLTGEGAARTVAEPDENTGARPQLLTVVDFQPRLVYDLSGPQTATALPIARLVDGPAWRIDDAYNPPSPRIHGNMRRQLRRILDILKLAAMSLPAVDLIERHPAAAAEAAVAFEVRVCLTELASALATETAHPRHAFDIIARALAVLESRFADTQQQRTRYLHAHQHAMFDHLQERLLRATEGVGNWPNAIESLRPKLSLTSIASGSQSGPSTGHIPMGMTLSLPDETPELPPRRSGPPGAAGDASASAEGPVVEGMSLATYSRMSVEAQLFGKQVTYEKYGLRTEADQVRVTTAWKAYLSKHLKYLNEFASQCDAVRKQWASAGVTPQKSK